MSFAFGGATVATMVTLGVIVIVIGLVRLAAQGGFTSFDVAEGTGVCFACRGSFRLAEMRHLSKWVAALGPSTYVARQNAHCNRCARRQEVMVATLILFLLGFGAAFILERLTGG